MRIRDRIVALPPSEGARAVVLGLLEEAADAAEGFAAGAGDEPLHDFRVAVRRLRSALRAFRPWIGDGAGHRSERRLKKVARSTSAARDAEVQLAWLETVRGELSAPARRAGYAVALARLEERLRAGPDAARVVRRFRREEEKLRRRLDLRRPDRSGEAGSFGAALASLVREHASALAARVEAIRDAADQRRAHEARIAAKRLRYLLEPLRGHRRADSSGAVARLKKLQDVLGDLHDAHVLAGELGDALAEAAAERARRIHAAVLAPGGSGASRRSELQASPRPGLLTLARLVRRRRDALFGTLERAWRSGELDALAGEVRAVADALEGPGAAVATRSRSVTLLAAARRAPARRTRRRSPPGGRQARAAPLDRPPGERSTDASGRATTVRARGHGIRRRLSL